VKKEHRIYSSRLFEKQVKKIPGAIRKGVEMWIKSIELKGLCEIRQLSGYHDEPLQGKRFGKRSIRLNKSYRLIYEENKIENIIILLEVTKHDY